MKFLPYENFTITTRLSSNEILKRLEDSVEPRKGFQWIRSTSSYKPYQGEIKEAAFSISRIINYRNSFLPQISGEIGPGTIKINMHLHPFVLVFVTFWLGSVGCMFLFMLSQFLMTNNEDIPLIGLIAPLGMFLFGYLLTLGGFKAEARQSKEFLMELFEAEIR